MKSSYITFTALAAFAGVALVQQADASSVSDTIKKYNEVIRHAEDAEYNLSKLASHEYNRDEQLRAANVLAALIREHEVGSGISRRDLAAVPRSTMIQLAERLKRCREVSDIYIKQLIALKNNPYERQKVLVATLAQTGVAPKSQDHLFVITTTLALVYESAQENLFRNDLDFEPYFLTESRERDILQIQESIDCIMAYLRKIAPQEAESLMRRTAEIRAKIQKDVERIRQDNYYGSPYLREFCRKYPR